MRTTIYQEATEVKLHHTKDWPEDFQELVLEVLGNDFERLPEIMISSPIALADLKESIECQLDSWEDRDFEMAFEYALRWLHGSEPPPIVVDGGAEPWALITDGYHRAWAAHCLDIRPPEIHAIWLCRIRAAVLTQQTATR